MRDEKNESKMKKIFGAIKDGVMTVCVIIAIPFIIFFKPTRL